MNNNEFYNVKDVSFADRESFNNAILLLTMIKSEYYYIVGFSRPDNTIKLAFDYETAYFTNIAEVIEIHFTQSKEYIEFVSVIQNVELGYIDDEIRARCSYGNLSLLNNKVVYTMTAKKDAIFPESIRDLNKLIQIVIADIKSLLNYYFNESVK